MEETTAPRFRSRGILVALGVAFVVAAIWAAAALASGGSSGPTPSGTGTPPGGVGTPSASVESSQGSAAAPSREDCPGHGAGSGGDSAPSDGSSSSGGAL